MAFESRIKRNGSTAGVRRESSSSLGKACFLLLPGFVRDPWPPSEVLLPPNDALGVSVMQPVVALGFPSQLLETWGRKGAPDICALGH